jgi:hypothetical protein
MGPTCEARRLAQAVSRFEHTPISGYSKACRGGPHRVEFDTQELGRCEHACLINARVNAPSCTLTPRTAGWPKDLERRLGTSAPSQLHLRGAPGLLGEPLTALFCSARCPGDAILRTYDQAAHWRDTGRAVISGFHSPMEKECLRILLRGRQPIVLCPARGLPVRIAPELRPALAAGRLLIVTAFSSSERRATTDLAERRNLLVASLATDVWFAHVTSGGRMERLAERIAAWAKVGWAQTTGSGFGGRV